MRSNYRPIMAILIALLALPAARLDAAATAKTEAELRSLREQIDRITQQVSRDALERDRLSGSLKAAELSVGQARVELSRASRDYADRSARRAAAGAETRQQQQQALLNERAALAAQLRVAYMIGREEPLKLLLNQQDPLHSGRLFAYYGYFGRARAGQISADPDPGAATGCARCRAGTAADRTGERQSGPAAAIAAVRARTQ